MMLAPLHRSIVNFTGIECLPPATGQNERMEEILIIDDSQQICTMLAEYVLPELGYRALVANTGRQGLNRLRHHLPDLILLDL